MAQVKPLPADANPDLQDTLKTYQNYLGFKRHGWKAGKHAPDKAWQATRD